MMAHIELQSYASGTAFCAIEPCFTNNGSTVVGKWENQVRIFKIEAEEPVNMMMEQMN